MSSEEKTDRTQLSYWLGRAINRILSGDSESVEALCRYEGKVVAIDLINTDTVFYMQILDNGVLISTTCQDKPDVLIKTTPLALLEYVRVASSTDGTASGMMEIRGDIGLAQQILSVFKKLEPDWEEQLAMWTGDTIAHKAGRLLSLSTETFYNLDRSLRQNAAEYLLYETESVVTPGELDGFYQEVDKVRDGTERLRARLEWLQRSLEGR